MLKGDKNVLFSFVGGKSAITLCSEVELKRQNIDAFTFVWNLTKSATTNRGHICTALANFRASDLNSFVVTHLAYIYGVVPNDTAPLFQDLAPSQEKRSTRQVWC